MKEADYAKEKAQRRHKFKEEKSVLERGIPDLIEKIDATNFILGIIAMILFGIFIKLMVISW